MIEPYRKIREQGLTVEKDEDGWLKYNDRYIRTFLAAVGDKFKSKILDLGCGTDHLSKACRARGYEAEGIDFDRCDFETHKLPYPDASFNVITMIGVLEHIRNTDNIMKETYRVLCPSGIVIILTPNWQMDAKNFYNDPTHIKPFSPKTLDTVMRMYGLKTIFMGPSLICKSKIYWKLPSFMKWRVASMLWGGTKSIIGIGEKNREAS